MPVSTFDEIYATDPEKSEKGVPITIGINARDKPVILFVAEAGSERHVKVQRKHEKALARARNNKTLYNRISARIIAEAILVNWEGVLDENGNEAPCTLDNRHKALMDHKRLLLTVLEASQDPENYRPDIDEEMTDDEEAADTEKN